MKTLDKYKKKLKTWKWFNKNFGNIVAISFVSMIIGSFILAMFAPWPALILRIVGLSSGVVGGITHLAYADNTEHGIMLEKKVAAMEHVTERSVEVLEENIKFYTENPTQFKDKKSTKNLVKELIKVKKCAKKALEEQKDEIDELTFNM